jgi:alkanesulfonate monooxygenase SsuD/methylene tetrahydromethanopterin reductase-like flavin-dependent oxidoreductase (luciferase family)
MWTREKSTFTGKHYQVMDIDKAGELQEGDRPKLLVGGGGRRLLSIAGRYADIVGITFNWRGSRLESLKAANYDSLKQKVEWAKKAAEASSRELNELEFQMLIYYSEITDEPDSIIKRVADAFGCSVNDVKRCPHFLIGSSQDLVEKLKNIREETGINYFALQLRPDQLDEYSKNIIEPLTSPPS